MRSKTDSPPLVMYWSRMAEIRATVFPDFEGPRKMPVHGTRGTIGSRGCFEVYSAFPFRRSAISWHSRGGREYSWPRVWPGQCRLPCLWAVSGCRPSRKASQRPRLEQT